MPRRWFDAHLDLACLAENGRDMAAPIERCGGPPDPAVTFGTLRDGGIAACLATVFTEPDGDDAVRYKAGDAQGAHAAGVRQIQWYQQWHRDGHMKIGPFAAQPLPTPDSPLAGGILIEGADPVRDPDELSWWVRQGVVAVGLAWARRSRYSGGNSTPDEGLTDLGRELIRRIDASGLVHDLSHLSDPAMDELLATSRGRVMASHSNCRTLHDGKNQRHLRDGSIRAITQRGGMIGLNLYRKFLDPPGKEGQGSLEDAANHVEHICAVVGHRRSVGLGSDMDGGFGASSLPAGMTLPVHLERLAGILALRGWSEEEIEGFAWGNWARFWEIG